VARRLAENQDAQVLLLEAGGEDLTPGIVITETWFLNLGGEFDWNFAAERSPSVNNRSIAHAMGKAIGGGTSINAMVWARGHKNDFDHWAKEVDDDAWSYRHVLDIYRRIEDWHGVPDPQRRGSGGEVFVQPLPIQAPSRRPSSGPQGLWASRPSPTRTALCRKVRAARRSPMCVSATAAG
jgi:choline dehydrogenase